MSIGCVLIAGLSTSANAGSVTVTDVTDWSTTPMEVVNADLPYLGYNGGVYAGINTLSVNNDGTVTVYDGFCIDPFHWSASGPSSPYYIVSLNDAPKNPATMNTYTATEIEDLWAEFFSPTMSSAGAAGLQIAIWELVSSNAVANDGLPAADAFSLDGGNDYGASADLASLATYDGPAASLMALTGPGQDYVIDMPPPPRVPVVPDGGTTFALLLLAVGSLFGGRSALIKALQPPKLQPVRVRAR